MSIRDMTDEERLNWLRLFRSENVGPIAFQRLLEHYGSAEAALEAIPDLARHAGAKRSPKIASMASVEAEVLKTEKFGGRFIALPEADYPPLLRNIPDPPPVISVLGRTDLLQHPSIAIVGARNASSNGAHLARLIAHELSQNGITIVSGMARGIDTAAHQGAGASNTIAVLAGGIDNIYPRENHELYRDIAQSGCIVSEMPFGTSPQARHFPRRNRIVSGLSLGTLVVEATIRSGSLITAKLAADQGREVMAIPGSPADSLSSGPNSLIKDGAILIENASDVLEIVQQAPEQPSFFDHMDRKPVSATKSDIMGNLSQKQMDREATLTQNQKQSRVLGALTSTPLGIDSLYRDCELSAAEGAVILLELELAGKIERLPGQKVALRMDGMA